MPAAAAFVQAQFLPVVLVTAICVGCSFPQAGVAVSQLPNLTAFVTTAMFVISGLQLRQGEALQALKARGAVAFGIISILLITPLISLAVLRLPLHPPELAIGLAVFCCMPTALSSGVTLTQQIGGNVALALLLTVSTNMLGVFTMPFTLPALLGPALAGSVRLEPLPLLVKLVKTILVPSLVGASIRAFVPGAAAFVDARKKYLTYSNALLLALVPWTQISKAVAQRVPLEAGSLLVAAAAGVGVHLAFLALNIGACRLLRLGGPDPAAALAVRRAVILVGSVKTLPVAVSVLASLGPALGPMAGVAVVPAMSAHLSQIIIDSMLVARWQAQDRAAKAA
ncbi:hypothetical protein MNEG_2671 [Monoraphidium neglectum]|uniref:Sodium/bile acid cotransporter 7 n=1 Tax=Monoraphidium neglectum TaxID=145388 RepID=A0A0D2MY54_9CHLO|nr:hypothetical protein MNEG_2671 [Monoraphidium neglectum]KIZ05282.1 hypothetical protein MNEG_2671 [Monoraphidium neglectum]|eukprot:XP_013904301.1 hypothetical protein MNEG_2671 [Monoraphidium neglectum]